MSQALTAQRPLKSVGCERDDNADSAGVFLMHTTTDFPYELETKPGGQTQEPAIGVLFRDIVIQSVVLIHCPTGRANNRRRQLTLLTIQARSDNERVGDCHPQMDPNNHCSQYMGKISLQFDAADGTENDSHNTLENDVLATIQENMQNAYYRGRVNRRLQDNQLTPDVVEFRYGFSVVKEETTTDTIVPSTTDDLLGSDTTTNNNDALGAPNSLQTQEKELKASRNGLSRAGKIEIPLFLLLGLLLLAWFVYRRNKRKEMLDDSEVEYDDNQDLRFKDEETRTLEDSLYDEDDTVDFTTSQQSTTLVSNLSSSSFSSSLARSRDGHDVKKCINPNCATCRAARGQFDALSNNRSIFRHQLPTSQHGEPESITFLRVNSSYPMAQRPQTPFAMSSPSHFKIVGSTVSSNSNQSKRTVQL